MVEATDAAQYIDKLKRLLSVETDKELAEATGFSKANVASWRSRKKIPLSVESRLVDQLGPEAAFSNMIRYTADRREDFIVFALFMVIRSTYARRLPKAIGPTADVRWGEAFSHCELALRRAVREIGFGFMRREEVYETIAKRIKEESLPDVIRGVDVYVRAYTHPELEPFTEDDFDSIPDYSPSP